uniref:Putative secreted protein n=1 Tax=Anopheles marajoara TaxID=58244 RepID=A0A2M4CB65_9DIPT
MAMAAVCLSGGLAMAWLEIAGKQMAGGGDGEGTLFNQPFGCRLALGPSISSPLAVGGAFQRYSTDGLHSECPLPLRAALYHLR